jgi:hypothetical protein
MFEKIRVIIEINGAALEELGLRFARGLELEEAFRYSAGGGY